MYCVRHRRRKKNDLSTDVTTFSYVLYVMRSHKKYNVPSRYITIGHKTRKTDCHNPFQRRAFPEIIDPQRKHIVRRPWSDYYYHRRRRRFVSVHSPRVPSIHKILVDFPL